MHNSIQIEFGLIDLFHSNYLLVTWSIHQISSFILSAMQYPSQPFQMSHVQKLQVALISLRFLILSGVELWVLPYDFVLCGVKWGVELWDVWGDCGGVFWISVSASIIGAMSISLMWSDVVILTSKFVSQFYVTSSLKITSLKILSSKCSSSKLCTFSHNFHIPWKCLCCCFHHTYVSIVRGSMHNRLNQKLSFALLLVFYY